MYAAIHALYHSPALLDVKNQVLQDVVRRRIHYPPSFSLHRSIISNVTGKPLPTTTQDGVISLVENIVETILLETANFVAVVDNIRTMVSRMNEFSSLEIINLGPGNGLSKILARTFPESKVSMVDWTCDEVEPGIIPNPNLRAVPSPDSIAIIGVAIKFPEANDLGSLWNILENGLNTISEVRYLSEDVGAMH